MLLANLSGVPMGSLTNEMLQGMLAGGLSSSLSQSLLQSMPPEQKQQNIEHLPPQAFEFAQLSPEAQQPAAGLVKVPDEIELYLIPTRVCPHPNV